MVAVWFGGERLDTDDGTRLGFLYKSGFCERDGGGEKSRSFDFSVPETPHNNKTLVYSEDPAMDGVRRSARGTVIDGGVWMQGRIYLAEWSSHRYSMLFIMDNTPAELDIPAQGGLFRDTLVAGKEEAVTGGAIPNFSFYDYENGTNPVGGGTVTAPLPIYPTCNLGYIIDTMASAAGYIVNYPPDLILDAHNYGLILDSMSAYEEHTVDILGTPAGGFAVSVDGGGGTMSQAGFRPTLGTRMMSRGWPFRENVFVRTFQADRHIKIKLIQDVGTYAYMTGDGYSCYNGEGFPKPTPIGNGHLIALGTEFDLNAGDYFTVVNVGTDARQGDRFWWWGPLQPNPGYTGVVTTRFVTLTDDGVAQGGAIISLADNFPQELTLKQLLQAFCDIIAGYYEVDEASGIIEVSTFAELMSQMAVGVDLNKMRVMSVSSVRRYIDGWSQHNLVRCQSAGYVTENCKFIRDYPCANDYLDESQDWAEIPFNEGNWEIRDYGGQNYKVAVMQDVTAGGNGEYQYSGVLSVIRESPPHVPALHIQTTTDEGVGQEFGDFTGSTLTIDMTVQMPLFRFLKIRKRTLAHWLGNTYIIREAAWDSGVCKLTLLRLA